MKGRRCSDGICREVPLLIIGEIGQQKLDIARWIATDEDGDVSIISRFANDLVPKYEELIRGSELMGSETGGKRELNDLVLESLTEAVGGDVLIIEDAHLLNCDVFEQLKNAECRVLLLTSLYDEYSGDLTENTLVISDIERLEMYGGDLWYAIQPHLRDVDLKATPRVFKEALYIENNHSTVLQIKKPPSAEQLP